MSVFFRKLNSTKRLVDSKDSETPSTTITANTTTTTNTTTTLRQFLVKEQTLNKDFSLTLVSHNIPARNESFLRENLAKRVEKGTLYASSSNVSSFALGFKQADMYADTTGTESMCYYRRDSSLTTCNDGQQHEFLLCFLADDSKFNLDLYPFLISLA